ncbi:MAG TPA: hypothetical protein VK427_03450 [Kofleriaceae bacterium]|nr:hypothetical protein [Kofleriaceae bacterium]
MRTLLVVALVAACSSPPAAKRPIAGTPVPPVAGGTKPTSTTPSGPSVVKDIGCLKASCAFHAGAAGYFTCQSGGAGTCFHFGAACTPENACMYDPAVKSYKQCTKPVEGTCQVWAAACAPPSKCMFDATDNLHKTCDSVDGGTCKKFGALCAP